MDRARPPITAYTNWLRNAAWREAFRLIADAKSISHPPLSTTPAPEKYELSAANETADHAQEQTIIATEVHIRPPSA